MNDFSLKWTGTVKIKLVKFYIFFIVQLELIYSIIYIQPIDTNPWDTTNNFDLLFPFPSYLETDVSIGASTGQVETIP